MLSESERHIVVEALLEANRTKIQTTPPSALYPDIEFEDSYTISAEVARRTIEPDFGYLFQHFLHADGTTLKRSDFYIPRVELELAFVLKDTLQEPNVSLLDVMRATEYIVPAIEIIDARVDEPRKTFDTIADNGAGAGLILGGRPVRPHDVDLRMIPGILSRNAEIEETGVSCGVMGHPANAVA